MGLLAACSGSGGDEQAAPATNTPTQEQQPASLVVTGTAAAGVVAQAQVAVYDASTATGAHTDQPIATTTTDNDGVYQVSLPAGFAKPLLIRVAGRSDGRTTVRDSVFGPTPVTEAFVLLAVVPADHLAQAGARVTAHVTAFTHAMAAYVGNRLGRSDIDDAVVNARTLVSTHLTAGADPLTTPPSTQATMVALLAAASNIANNESSSFRNDPEGCAAKAAVADKIICTLKTVAGVLQPLPATSGHRAALQLNHTHATALSDAARDLNLSVVAANTGLPTPELSAGKATASAALAKTEVAALVANAASDVDGLTAFPPIGYTVERGSTMIIASGTQAGSYQGWTYAVSRCLGFTGRCPDFNIRATVTPEDVLEDPGLIEAANRAAADLAREIGALQRAVYAKGKRAYPSVQTFIDAMNAAFTEGLQAQSVAAFAAAARTGLAAAGFPVDEGSGSASGSVPKASEEQLAAAKACDRPEAYVNTSSPTFDPQLDSNCRLAQVNACLHRAGITAYDEQGRLACRVVNGLINSLTGTWRCGYCEPSYPF